MDFLAVSSDLNPIENLWSIVKRKIKAKCPKTQTELKKAIVEAWVREITTEVCQRLVHSMPGRIEAVINNNGFPTKY